MSGTAEVHPESTLVPSKRELLMRWLPSQPWFSGTADDLEVLANYRFVDPAAEVGIETLLVRSGGVVYQVPLTYRDAPLPDADAYLLGTAEHSVLGTRYVYDATVDPVYVSELIRVITEGDTEADRSSGEKTMTVQGTGVTSGVDVAGQVRIARTLVGGQEMRTGASRGLLVATWSLDGEPHETVVARLR